MEFDEMMSHKLNYLVSTWSEMDVDGRFNVKGRSWTLQSILITNHMLESKARSEAHFAHIEVLINSRTCFRNT